VQFKGSAVVLITFYTLAQLLFFLVLTKLPTMLKLPFYPSYAALTFPLVITATATNEFIHAFQFEGTLKTMLSTYFALQLLLAICIVVYVLIRYVNYLSVQIQQKRQLAA
jgi:exfoliative toxin A/B